MVTIGFDPVIARLGAFEVGWHGVVTVIAVWIAVWLGLRAATRAGFPTGPTSDVVVAAVVGGLVGARLFYVLDHLPRFLNDPLATFAIWEGGIAVYGAFIGGITVGAIAAVRVGLPVWRGLDLAAGPMLVGQAVGRLGCLANGDAWGAPTRAEWGLAYTHPNDLLPRDLLGVPTHPYPLYEMGAVLALGLALVALRRRRLGSGVLFLWAALGYAAIRFSLSFFRQETVVAFALQEAQLVALATAALAALFLGWRTLARPVGARSEPIER
ncbi:MAG: prolipoprotein diacylglyceryl transferase [Chloroflexi bacterium]|nr:prolipoprotein diacylglyceryl transferase [Chloroflexota bacterium]